MDGAIPGLPPPPHEVSVHAGHPLGGPLEGLQIESLPPLEGPSHVSLPFLGPSGASPGLRAGTLDKVKADRVFSQFKDKKQKLEQLEQKRQEERGQRARRVFGPPIPPHTWTPQSLQPYHCDSATPGVPLQHEAHHPSLHQLQREVQQTSLHQLQREAQHSAAHHLQRETQHSSPQQMLREAQHSSSEQVQCEAQHSSPHHLPQEAQHSSLELQREAQHSTPQQMLREVQYSSPHQLQHAGQYPSLHQGLPQVLVRRPGSRPNDPISHPSGDRQPLTYQSNQHMLQSPIQVVPRPASTQVARTLAHEPARQIVYQTIPPASQRPLHSTDPQNGVNMVGLRTESVTHLTQEVPSRSQNFHLTGMGAHHVPKQVMFQQASSQFDRQPRYLNQQAMNQAVSQPSHHRSQFPGVHSSHYTSVTSQPNHMQGSQAYQHGYQVQPPLQSQPYHQQQPTQYTQQNTYDQTVQHRDRLLATGQKYHNWPEGPVDRQIHSVGYSWPHSQDMVTRSQPSLQSPATPLPASAPSPCVPQQYYEPASDTFRRTLLQHSTASGPLGKRGVAVDLMQPPKKRQNSGTEEDLGGSTTSKQKRRESPVDLSVRTVRRSADSTALGDAETVLPETSQMSSSIPRIDFVPDFSASQFDLNHVNSQARQARQALPRARELLRPSPASSTTTPSSLPETPSLRPSMLPLFSSNTNSLYPSNSSYTGKLPFPNFGGFERALKESPPKKALIEGQIEARLREEASRQMLRRPQSPASSTLPFAPGATGSTPLERQGNRMTIDLSQNDSGGLPGRSILEPTLSPVTSICPSPSVAHQISGQSTPASVIRHSSISASWSPVPVTTVGSSLATCSSTGGDVAAPRIRTKAEMKMMQVQQAQQERQAQPEQSSHQELHMPKVQKEEQATVGPQDIQTNSVPDVLHHKVPLNHGAASDNDSILKIPASIIQDMMKDKGSTPEPDPMWSSACDEFLVQLECGKKNGNLRKRLRRRNDGTLSPALKSEEPEQAESITSQQPLTNPVHEETTPPNLAGSDRNEKASQSKNCKSPPIAIKDEEHSSNLKTTKTRRKKNALVMSPNDSRRSKKLPPVKGLGTGTLRTVKNKVHCPRSSSLEESECSVSSEDSPLSKLIGKKYVAPRMETRSRRTPQDRNEAMSTKRLTRKTIKEQTTSADMKQASARLTRQHANSSPCKGSLPPSPKSVKPDITRLRVEKNVPGNKEEGVQNKVVKKNGMTEPTDTIESPKKGTVERGSESEPLNALKRLRSRKEKFRGSLKDLEDKGEAQHIPHQHKKPTFGDGSDFRPGWEEEVFQYKRSLRMPQILISVSRAGSSTDLDRCNSPSTSVTTDNTEWNAPRQSSVQDSAVDSDFDSASNCHGLDSEEGTCSSILSASALKRSNSQKRAILDQLVEKVVRKSSSVELNNKKTKSNIRRNNKTSELLPAPIKSSVGVFKYKAYDGKKPITNFRDAFRVNGLLQGKEKNTKQTQGTKHSSILRAVFGEYQDECKSPNKSQVKSSESSEALKSEKKSTSKNCVDKYARECVNAKKVIKKKKKDERTPFAGVVLRPRAVKPGAIGRPGLRSAALVRRSKVVLNTKRHKSRHLTMPPPSINVCSETAPQGTILRKRMRLRRKFRSGFDYIRKKKKQPAKKAGDNSLVKEKEKEKVPVTRPPMTEEEIQGLIRSWVINRSHGDTVLHRAARHGYTDVVKFAIQRLGIQPSVTDNAGFSPLHEAARRGHVDTAHALLQLGANVSSSATGGVRPFHEASESNHIQMMRLLLAYGADPTLATYSAQTPLSGTDPGSEAHAFLSYHLADMEGRPAPPWKFQGPSKIFDEPTHPGDLALQSPPSSSDSESEIDVVCTEIQPPPFYAFDGDQRNTHWVLLNDLMRVLQKDREDLLRCLNVNQSSDQCDTSDATRSREMTAHDFYSFARRTTFTLSFQDICEDKVTLLQYNDKVRSLLGEEITTVSSR